MIKKIVALFFIPLTVQATELHQQGESARSMAMGGTYTSFVKGAEAIYYNPAALARVQGFDFIIGQAHGAYSKDAARFVAQTQNSGSTLTLADINGFYGLNSFAEVTANSGFAMPFFGVGVYSSNYILESFNNPPFPTFNATFLSDYGYVIGAAYPVGPATSFGIAARHIQRWGGNQDILITNLIGSNDKTLLQNTFQDRGVGNAMDLAFMTTLSGSLAPTLSFVWKDVGRTTFQQTAGTSAPPSQGDNLIFGASFEQETSIIKWTHALEYKYIATPNEDFSKKIHLGTEASMGFFDLRAGLNQGYVTYGAGVDLWFIKADAAYFASELGNAAGQLRNDRVIYSLTIELDFDQSFKLNNMEGKKRRLKQRR